MTPEHCEFLFAQLQAHNPTPTIELNYRTPFELLVAVVLSARTTDKTVNKVTADLFPVANTPAAFVELGEEKLRHYIKTIGLSNTKARNLIKTSEILIVQYQSEVPSDRESLESLPGVGRKSANVILNTIFGEATIAVDTHILRVGNRTGLAPGKTPREVEDKLMQVVPDKYRQQAHHWLVLHGRYVCTARKPKCEHCVIAAVCQHLAIP